MSDSYVYPGTTVLKNKLDIRDAKTLAYHERELVTQRIAEGVPRGDFDLAHLQTIHRHLFQDIYAWAGEVRTTEISKGGHQFQFRQFIHTGMADVHRRIVSQGYLTGLDRVQFAAKAGEIMGDVNYVHPFREGNGRTQMQYLKQLAERAGHPLDLTRIPPRKWIEASRQAHDTRYQLMAQCIGGVISDRANSAACERVDKLRQKSKERRPKRDEDRER